MFIIIITACTDTFREMSILQWKQLKCASDLLLSPVLKLSFLSFLQFLQQPALTLFVYGQTDLGHTVVPANQTASPISV